MPYALSCNTIQVVPAKCTPLRLRNLRLSVEMLKYQVGFPTKLFDVRCLRPERRNAQSAVEGLQRRARREIVSMGSEGLLSTQPSAAENRPVKRHVDAVNQGSLHFPWDEGEMTSNRHYISKLQVLPPPLFNAQVTFHKLHLQGDDLNC